MGAGDLKEANQLYFTLLQVHPKSAKPWHQNFSYHGELLKDGLVSLEILYFHCSNPSQQAKTMFVCDVHKIPPTSLEALELVGGVNCCSTIPEKLFIHGEQGGDV